MAIKTKLTTIFSAVFLLIVFILIILRVFFLENYVVRSGSMKETLHHGDYILSWKLVRLKKTSNHFHFIHASLKRKDIIIFQVPGEREILIKRIIGLPGDSIEFKETTIVVNGIPLIEPYAHQGLKYKKRTIMVPGEKLFVLGDMRSTSRDSREFGFLEIDNIKGRVFFIYYPFHRIRCFF